MGKSKKKTTPEKNDEEDSQFEKKIKKGFGFSRFSSRNNSSYSVNKIIKENKKLKKKIANTNHKMAQVERKKNELEKKMKESDKKVTGLIDYNKALKINIDNTKTNLETSENFGKSAFLLNEELHKEIARETLEIGILNEELHKEIVLQNENLLQEIKKMEQDYSTDEQKVYYLNQQILLLQYISFYFFIIYYIILCIFIYSFIYGKITYSRNIIIFVSILFAIYPYVISLIEYILYEFSKYIYSLINGEVYTKKI